MDLEVAIFSAWETDDPLVIATIFNELERGRSRRVSMFRMLKLNVFGEEEGRRWRFKGSHITREGNNTAAPLL